MRVCRLLRRFSDLRLGLVRGSGCVPGVVARGGGTTTPPPSPLTNTPHSPVPAPAHISDTSLILTRTLSPFSKHLKAAHINAQSLIGHIDEVRTLFENESFDIIGISESWLKPSIQSNLVSLPGYSLIRNDRVNKVGGGVCVFIKEGLKAKLLYSTPSDYSSRPEFMFIEIIITSSDVLLLAVCYKPPKIGYLIDFENVLLRFLPSYSRVLVMGDFNTDLHNTNITYGHTQLTTMFHSCNLDILPLGPTHHTATSHTLLDLLVVSDQAEVLHFGQIPVPGVSHHDLVYCVFSIRAPMPPTKYISFRRLNRIDNFEFFRDVQTIDWDAIQKLSSVNEMVDTLNSKIVGLFDKHAPIIKIRVNRKRPVPWMNNDIRKLMAQRDSHYRRARRSGEEDAMATYRRLRNRVKQLLRNSRLRYIRSLFLERKQSSKSLWSNVKKVGLGKQPTHNSVDVPLNELNNFFVSSYKCSDPKSVEDYISEVAFDPSPNVNSFNFKPIITGDVLKAMRKVRTNAVGSDNISIHLLNKIMFAILPTLTFIFNASIKQGIFPEQWKSSLVRPLNKIPSPRVCQDFRPISILPVLSKGLERIVHWQIVDFLNAHNILNTFQSGFRPNHSTETALLRVTDDIRWAMECKKVTILTLFDFSKAFDCVNHRLLLLKLRAVGFSPGALSWMSSYISDRRQCVRVGDTTSECEPVTCGVPQGSILGPLLFSLYVNDINTQITHCKFHMYADDLQIYKHFKVQDIDQAIGDVNSDIFQIVSWTKRHGLKLNPTKTKPIIICHSRLRNTIDTDNIRPITVDGTTLPYYDKVKNLGITFNTTLTWTDTVVETCNKIFAGIHSLKRLQRFLPEHIKLMLVKSLIFPHFHYCNSVYNDLTTTLADKLQRTQNYCIRFVYDLRWDERITIYYVRSRTLKLLDERSIKILSLLYSIRQNDCPKYFSDTFEVVLQRSARDTRFGATVLRIPNHNSVIFDKSFTVTACRLWNSLPTNLQSIQNRRRFVLSLREQHLDRMTADV